MLRITITKGLVELKKVTLKEIAKETGVSAATVSYVLNNVSNQTIAEDTRTRIIEAAKTLGYVPNLAARSLVKQKSGLIGVLINRTSNDEASWQQIRHSKLINELEAGFGKHGYHLILHSLNAAEPRLDIIAERKLDGVIVVDALGDRFHQISSYFPYGVPVLIVDSLINDPLFYQIVFDFKDAFARIGQLHQAPEQYYVVLDNYNNKELLDHITDLLPVSSAHLHIMSDEQQLQQFIETHKERKGIIMNEAIALLAAKYTAAEQLTVICTAGMSELLPRQATAISFQQQKGKLAVEQLIQLLHNQDGNNSYDKTIEIKAE